MVPPLPHPTFAPTTIPMQTHHARTTITAALPYTNGPVHIGHLAGVYLPADIYARFLRLTGKPVLFVCGSDEHGVPITIRAAAEGLTPQQVVDKYHAIIKESFSAIGISTDIYHRTSSPLHHQVASQFFTTLHDGGELEQATAPQYFDPEVGKFLADRYIEGTCPNCAFERAYGDQCENCGTSLSPEKLINPRSKLSGATPVLKDATHWYFPLNRWQEWLSQHILEDHKDDWRPNVLGQCRSWLTQGLEPRAVTRDLDWGVPVPLNAAEGGEGKVLYVWFDAPIGYISATQAWANEHNQDWEQWWKTGQNDKQGTPRLLHFIGKDNIVFHCIMFPAMLQAHNRALGLKEGEAGAYVGVDNVPANEFLNLEGQKISTSRNWAVWLHEYLEELPGREDELRYVLCATAPETKDNDFTWADYQNRVNGELVAVLGNFVNRAVTLVHKWHGGHVPAAHLSHEDKAFLSEVAAQPAKIAEAIEGFRFREALQSLMEMARLGNRYLAEHEPWKLIKTDASRADAVLVAALQASAMIGLAARPFMPAMAEKLCRILRLEAGALPWLACTASDHLEEGLLLGPAELLFQKVEDETVAAQRAKLKAMAAAALAATEASSEAKIEPSKPLQPLITYDDFAKLDLRVGVIVAAEKVKGADKLLKLTLNSSDLDDAGAPRDRIVVSGIAEHFAPEAIIGQQVVVLANLAPRKLRGIESEGMILMAETANGGLAFVAPSELVLPGAGVR